jgi:hypothetical protein
VSVRRLIALLAALALALVPSACGSNEGDAGSARELLKHATEHMAKSANLKFELEASLEGVDELKGPVKLGLEGPYRSNGQGKLPDFDWKLHGEAAGKSLDARLVAVGGNAFVEYGGTTYEVGQQLMGKLSQQLGRNQTDPQELRRLGFDASEWLKDPEESDAEAGGVPTKRVSGELDVRKALEDLDKLFRSPAVSGQLPPGGAAPRIPQDAIDKIEDAVKDSHIEADVGRDDGLLRRESFELRFEVPSDQRDRLKGLEGGELKTTIELGDVNGDQQVTPPSGARPIEELLRRIGIPPELLLGPGFSTPAPG